MAAALHVRLAEVPAHRDDVVIAFGGGVIGDLAGFVASTYARGLKLLQVPTSLLAQVDAAIGGKTGIDLPQGKNLVGTFWQPLGVVSDVGLLETLPSEELVSGLAEMIKYGLISDPRILEDVVAKRDEILRASPAVLADLVARCAAIKAEVVSADEREGGQRAFLNYGHTVGHAIEHASGYEGCRHGEAVALGMMAAAYLAAELGRIDEEAVRLHRTTLEAVGLPVRAALDLDSLEEAWDRDKKFRGGVRFVLLQSIGQPEAGIKVGRREIERALTRMAE
jgi:3-dehydroquinate synthase